jgi:hypothetical protein
LFGFTGIATGVADFWRRIEAAGETGRNQPTPRASCAAGKPRLGSGALEMDGKTFRDGAQSVILVWRIHD